MVLWSLVACYVLPAFCIVLCLMSPASSSLRDDFCCLGLLLPPELLAAVAVDDSAAIRFIEACLPTTPMRTSARTASITWR